MNRTEGTLELIRQQITKDNYIPRTSVDIIAINAYWHFVEECGDADWTYDLYLEDGSFNMECFLEYVHIACGTGWEGFDYE